MEAAAVHLTVSGILYNHTQPLIGCQEQDTAGHCIGKSHVLWLGRSVHLIFLLGGDKVVQQPFQRLISVQVLVAKRPIQVLAPERAVPVVLHAVVRAAGQQLCYVRPLVAMQLQHTNSSISTSM